MWQAWSSLGTILQEIHVVSEKGETAAWAETGELPPVSLLCLCTSSVSVESDISLEDM